MSSDPHQTPLPFECLAGEYTRYLFRRINIQHRIVYSVCGNVAEVAYCWTHYHGD
ncbi:MAG: type II toxin-antitoxin system YoeB family toxin [Puniceicoccales bacterium]|nr:type II toxin-antitoxin system YoeB family toxin [Puniceicoccales bacterium]